MNHLRDFWVQHDYTLDINMRLPQQISLSHDLYRGMPPWFNAFYAHFQTRNVTRMLRRCSLKKDSRVLDVGCGTGRWSAMLSTLGMKPIGVDIGFNALRVAKTWAKNASFCQEMLPSLSFTSTSFELIVSVTVLQHLPYSDQITALSEFSRVLQPGGYLIACEIVDVGDPASHVFQHNQSEWRSLFENTGFKLVEYLPTEYLPYVKWFQCTKKWFGKRNQVAQDDINVSFVVNLLQQHLFLAWLVKIGIIVSYPLEYIASWVLPKSMARQGGFLLQKE